ncbi:flavin-binding monooxygenase, partial [Acephala macrosclerotiorum]
QHRSIDDPRPLHIGIIGAGISGIGLYIRLKQYVPSAQITIWEKNQDVGGTWFENRYPGVKCDIPSHVYQYTFEPNTQWSQFFSGGEEIWRYVKGVSEKYKVRENVFGKKVTGLTWVEAERKWIVGVRGVDDTPRKEEIKCDVVVNCTGVLNKWKMLDIEGLDGFKGTLMHSATLDEKWDDTDKDVALIGVGSSVIQILPHLQKKCKNVYQYARGKAWISEPFGGAATLETISGDKESGNYTYSEEELTKFKEDPEHYHQYRKHIERFINLDHPCLFPGTEAAVGGKERFIENMKLKLKKKPEIYEMLKPNFSPGCRRLIPGPGFLEALVEDNVKFSNSKILGVTEDAIVTADGKERKVDAIVCATGLDTSFLPHFPITGQNSIQLSGVRKDHVSAYLSLAIPSFPNFIVVGGPNSATGGGSLLIIFESIIGYIVKAIQKLAREHIASMSIKGSALKNWEGYCDSYFPCTVHIEGRTS